MTGRGQTKELMLIDDVLCNLKPTVVRIIPKMNNGNERNKMFETFSFIEGNGIVAYDIHDDMQPRMKYRLGVVCGFGDCGRG
uniref:Uncharacterized protein n=1 Tax=Setaria digitata TaxID=48799 RepID=A0A915PZ85_9BILA